MTTFQSMAHRAWFAYQALDLDDKGELPKIRALDRAHNIPHNSLNKLMRGTLVRPGYPVLKACAAALRCTPHWLQTGEGDGPVARRHVPPYPADWSKPKPRKKRASLADVLANADASEGPPLRIAQRSAEDVPRRGGSQLADKRKPSGSQRKTR